MKNLALKSFLGLPIFFVSSSCSNNSNSGQETDSVLKKNATTAVSEKFIKPPLNQVNVPFSHHSFSVEEGASITLPSGATIKFPSNSLLDINGDLVKGDVEVKLREFKDPFDFFVAGIPMTYDSSGTRYNFESTAMFELYVEQSSQAVFVNPENKPQINLGKAINLGDELYYLDSLKEKWVLIENGIEEEAAEVVTDSILTTSMAFAIGSTPKPVKPREPNEDRPSFTVAIPYIQDFPELKIFGDTKFEIDESEKNYNPAEADLEWDRVEIEEANTAGLYIVKFFRPNRKIAYRVRPVYEGEDFDSAMSIYSENMQEYNRRAKEWEKRKEEQEKAAEVLGIFKINQFGIWNCDRYMRSQTYPLNVNFVDEKQEPIKLNEVYVVSQGINGVVSYQPSQLRVLPNLPHALWSISDDKFLYFTFSDYQKIDLSEKTTKLTFQMRTYPGELNDYNDLKKVLGVF